MPGIEDVTAAKFRSLWEQQVKKGQPHPAYLMYQGLVGLLTEAQDGKAQRVSFVSLNDIQQAIGEEFGHVPPRYLIRMIGGRKLVWQYLQSPNRENGTSLFVGYEDPTAAGNASIHDALATIYIRRGISENPPKTVYAHDISIAGVAKDTMDKARVVSAKYSTHSNRAYHISVSVSEDELPWDITSKKHLGNRIPNLDDPYVGGGLVTTKMARMTEVGKSGPDTKTITMYDSTNAGYELQFADDGEFTNPLGFKIQSDQFSHGLTFNPPEGHITPFSITIPGRLTPLEHALSY